MAAEYVSLHRLVQRMGAYESMPLPVQQALRHSVLLTLATNVVAIPLLWLAPLLVQAIYPVSSQGFFIWFTADAANFLLWLTDRLSGCLLVLNILSLVLIGAVLLVSRGMTKPVKEPFHWLAWLGAFPSGMTIVSTGVILALFAAIVVVAIVIWVVIITLAVWLFFVVLSAITGDT